MIDLSQKTALVMGVADNVGFAWHIAKALANQNAQVIISCHPRVFSILERFLTKERYLESRMLPNGKEFSPKLVIPCDVSIDSKNDNCVALSKNILEEENDCSIESLVLELNKHKITLDALVHSVAFSPEVDKNHLDVSRNGYLSAMSVSSYSLVSLCRNLKPLMENKNASIVTLSYLAAERAVPFYGGAMASAKAALECDVRMLSWFLGESGHRINAISAGPYASRAAKSVGDIEKMVEKIKNKSPLKRAITAEDVAHTALFLCSDLSSAITGEVIHVDAGYHAMGAL